MLRSWKLLALPAALTLLAGLPPIVLAGGEGDTKQTVLEKLQQMDKRLEKSFKQISDDMAALQADALMAKGQLQAARDKVDQLEKDMAEAKKDFNQMRTDLDSLKRGAGTSTTKALYPPEPTSLESMARRLGKIEQDLARMTAPPRVSQYPTPATGRLKLVNDYAEEVQFVINGRSYRVAPGMTQVLEMPAGPFNYEVVTPTWGPRPGRTPTLASGDTFTLVAHLPP
jgi:hypothetical protein